MKTMPWLFAVLLTVVVAGVATSAQAAEFGLEPDSFTADAFQQDGATPETQAGARPFQATTRFQIKYDDDAQTRISGYARNISVKLPRGFVGNPEAAAKCSRARFDGLLASTATCPPESQVGVARITWKFVDVPAPEVKDYPVYNIQPKPGQTADFGIPVGIVPVHVTATVDASGDYRLRADSRDISQGIPMVSTELSLWGVPGDKAHNPFRACGGIDVGTGMCGLLGFIDYDWTREPFLTNPSECGGSTASTIEMTSWEAPGVWIADSYDAAAVTGCERLSFEPSIDIAPTTVQPDSPTGLSVDIELPQNEDPNGLGTPPLRHAKVTLPEGMSINPGSADGLAACSDAQLGLRSDVPIGCPLGSKIGSVTAHSPALEDPLDGGVYLRSQASDDPASGDMFRLALVLENKERGLLVKLPGSVKVDPNSGRIVTRFFDNPQLPVSRIELELKSGPRAPLATPASCGVKTIDTELSSWGGQVSNLRSQFTVPCTQGLGAFAPSFEAGALAPAAGASSPFALRVRKPDGQSAIDGVELSLPKGLLATLKGNVGQQVGTARVASGPGANPFWLSGPVVLEGPYGDAPFSLRVTVPAKAGPFDLGDVVVRQRIYVDPETAQVRVASDLLPTIVKGVPVRLQNLAVDIDRPGFTLNPTSCRPSEVKATLHAATGQTAAVSDRFRVGDCANLRFTPKLRMRLTGKRQTRTGSHPSLTTTVTQPRGQAGIAKAKVTLPRSVVLDPLNTVDPKMLCGYDESLKADCPASSVIGKASAVTPVLNRPLTGDVHLVQGIKFGPEGNRIRTTPSLLVKLRGEVSINLRGRTSTERGTNRLVTTFGSVPDAPVSKFTLKIDGGSKGILVVTRTRNGKINLCNKKQIADVETDGHNNKRADYRTAVKTPCAAKTARKAGRNR